ncbi:MAG: glycogen debranching enzyme, partial [Cyanobacteriota bacterium]|nr:glycogen debranching enzyme [Cyanobacteriota bacterium]
PEILALRERQKRNLLTTLMLSQGVPMLLAGDEMGRSQQGNNNAYCQDNQISWLDWELREENAQFLEFTRNLTQFLRDHPVFRRRKWFQGRAIYGSGISDLAWFNPDGGEMTEEQWQVGYAKAIAIFLNGEEIGTPNARGEIVVDESFLVLFNAHWETLEFALPSRLRQQQWLAVIDTSQPSFVEDREIIYRADRAVPVRDRSLVVLKRMRNN